ncbi:MAG: ATP-binding cassette domain-containing protein, partial [Acidobacteriota bacterium]|nr:ATP-binding cassette domain-containing protein [Acidobacteriota bacterium]
MALTFRGVRLAPFEHLDVSAPDGAVIGIIGDTGAGKSRLLRLAAGIDHPAAGAVKATGEAKFLGPEDALNLPPAAVLAIDRTFDRHDWLARERGAVVLDRLRRAGATIFLVSQEEDLVRRLADEV